MAFIDQTQKYFQQRACYDTYLSKDDEKNY